MDKRISIFKFRISALRVRLNPLQLPQQSAAVPLPSPPPPATARQAPHATNLPRTQKTAERAAAVASRGRESYPAASENASPARPAPTAASRALSPLTALPR